MHSPLRAWMCVSNIVSLSLFQYVQTHRVPQRSPLRALKSSSYVDVSMTLLWIHQNQNCHCNCLNVFPGLGAQITSWTTDEAETNDGSCTIINATQYHFLASLTEVRLVTSGLRSWHQSIWTLLFMTSRSRWALTDNWPQLEALLALHMRRSLCTIPAKKPSAETLNEEICRIKRHWQWRFDCFHTGEECTSQWTRKFDMFASYIVRGCCTALHYPCWGVQTASIAEDIRACFPACRGSCLR